MRAKGYLTVLVYRSAIPPATREKELAKYSPTLAPSKPARDGPPRKSQSQKQSQRHGPTADRRAQRRCLPWLSTPLWS